MTPTDFFALFQDTNQKLQRITITKGVEYSGHGDKLSNFKRNALALDLEPTTVWHTYAAKHWDAVTSFCRETQRNKKLPETAVLSEPIEGRIIDLILYLHLLMALVKERRDAETNLVNDRVLGERADRDPRCSDGPGNCLPAVRNDRPAGN